MTPKNKKSLELDKILLMLAQKATCSETKTAAAGLEPQTVFEEVRFALEETDAMTGLILRDASPRYSSCEGVCDAVSRAAKGGLLSMGELLLVACALRNFRYMSEWYRQFDEEAGILDNVFYALTPQPQLENNIYESILSDTDMADTASNTLYEIRQNIRRTESGIRDKLESMIRSPSTSKFLQNAVVSMRGGRFVVPVKAENRGDVGGVIHDVSSSGSTLFVEPTAVVEANAKILQLRNQEKEEIERILQAFSNQVAEFEPMFAHSYQAMLDIDMLVAKARLALEMGAMKPGVNQDMSFDLKKARHPLISRKTVVPVDVALGRDYDTMVITGPNTGGKTVTLKTAGLLCAMAACGLLIPAAEGSAVCVFEKILVDIGDEQSIEQSLSTFSGHMKNIAGILEEADEHSLVLLDELGAGTDPAEGAALAVSIIDRLRKCRARIMATTHYGEIKVYALEHEGVTNASCEFDLESLRPTYRLSIGVPGKSNAFLISQKLGIPQDVLSDAARHLSDSDRSFNSVLGQLEDLKLELKREQDEIERLKYEAAHQLESAQKKRDEIIRQGELELEQAREKAKQMALNVQNNAYALMDEMKQLQKQQNLSAQQRAQRAREIAKKDSEKLYLESDVVNAPEIHRDPLRAVHKGDTVLIGSLNQEGTALGEPDRGGMVEVQAGIFRTKVPLSGLYAPAVLKKPEKKWQPRSTGDRRGGDQVNRATSLELDLRGMMVDEAVLEVDRFIDHAVMNGLQTVSLIHGKGTGALRSGIQQHLRTHKNVKSFRLGAYGEGDSGVTVVELK